MGTRQSDSDRVRAEVGYDSAQRNRQIGRVVHEVLAAVAATGSNVDIDDVDRACADELVRKPIQAPKQLSRPLTPISTHATQGVRLLPPLDWELTAAELELPSGSRVDLVFESDEPLVVGGHIGDVVGYEVKQAASTDTAKLSSTVEQVGLHLDGLQEIYGDRLLGVVTLCLGHHSSCVLTLADPARSVVAYASTPLCTFPRGRLS